MALVGVELETLVSEPDALTTRPYFSFVQLDFITNRDTTKQTDQYL